jgi:hypothetical protein
VRSSLRREYGLPELFHERRYDMSWNFSGSGSNKSQTLASFREAQAKDTYCPFPEAVSAAVEALAQKFGEEQVVRINTYGHVNADGSGNVNISINC